LERVYENHKVNYLPIWIDWLAAAGWLGERIAPGSEPWRVALIKLLPIGADIATGGLIALALRAQSLRAALLGASAYVLNPALGYISAYWGQAESVYTLFLTASLIALNRGAIVWSWPLYALALGTKVQSVCVLPLVIVLTVKKQGVRGLVVGAALAALTAAALYLPWLLSGHFVDVAQTFAQWPNESLRVDVSAYNLW
jgi:Gpi18-like mannosyltransferase